MRKREEREYPLNNLNIETGGKEEEAEEGLEDALGGVSQEMEVEEDRGGEM